MQHSGSLSRFYFRNQNILDQANEEWIGQIGVHYIDYANERSRTSERERGRERGREEEREPLTESG